MLSELFEHVYIFSQYKYFIYLCFKCLNKYNISSIVVRKKKIVCKKYVYILKTFNTFSISALIINTIDSFVHDNGVFQISCYSLCIVI